MSYSEPKELIRARKLIEEAKFKEALQIIDKFREKKELSLHERISYYLLKNLLAGFNFNQKEYLKYANKAYQESHKLESSLQLLDVYIRMAMALSWQQKPNEAEEFIVKSEDLLKMLNREPSTELKKRKVILAWVKGYFYSQKGEVEKALKCAERCLALREELDLKVGIALSLWQLGQFSWQIGDLNRALEYTESSKILALELEYKTLIQRCYLLFGIIYSTKGELDIALKYNEQVLTFAEEQNNRFLISSILNNNGMIYQMQGNLDQALEYMEKSLVIAEEFGNMPLTIPVLDSLFHLALDRNELEQAQQYLHRIKQIKDKHKQFDAAYRTDRAVYLKTSPRALNRGKAEEILKQVIEEENIPYDMLVIALLNLCDLLLFELQATNELEILEELQTYISRVLDIALSSRSYSLLAETYLLQARLALITLDMNKARKLFTKSQNLAEKCGLNRLAMRISSEHDQLLKQLELWEDLRESKAPLEQRMELAHLNDQVVNMLKKRAIEPPKLEGELPVLFAVMTKEGDVVLSSPFTADMTIDDTYFGEFLSSCNTFCDQIFSESFDRVKFGQYTILIAAIDLFCVYYMFQGHSYNAQQKLSYFCEAVKKNITIMNTMKNAIAMNKVIEIHDNPSLEELIVESFLSDPQKFQMPFKAYVGDDPFIFVSYSHTDKLQVYPIIDYLNKKGIHIWYDEGIPISENWKKSIVENLDRCKAFLLFITPHIVDSDYVRKEISFASKRQKQFFGVYLKETELPKELEFDIADIQSMKKYLMPDSEFYPKLREVIYPTLYEQKIV